jgi:hypothetical protein
MSSLLERCFDALEKALVQLDRFSGLAERPVDYAELDKQSGLTLAGRFVSWEKRTKSSAIATLSAGHTLLPATAFPLGAPS